MRGLDGNGARMNAGFVLPWKRRPENPSVAARLALCWVADESTKLSRLLVSRAGGPDALARRSRMGVQEIRRQSARAVADNPGDTLLHCHQALHMDFGFMQLMKYVD
ncbi:MAG: multicopper oxidase domain-containing protein [Bryobacteraceae bacterium]